MLSVNLTYIPIFNELDYYCFLNHSTVSTDSVTVRLKIRELQMSSAAENSPRYPVMYRLAQLSRGGRGEMKLVSPEEFRTPASFGVCVYFLCIGLNILILKKRCYPALK